MNTLKLYKHMVMLIALLSIAGCAAVPKQLVDAIQVQQQEIKNVKETYFLNLNNQLDAIEKYQLAILEIYEEQYKLKYSKSLDEREKNGKKEVVETDPTGDKDLDHINLALLAQIETFFTAEKDSVRSDIRNRRAELQKLNKNFENIEQINQSINDYTQSLVRLKTSQDKLAAAIKTNLDRINPLPISINAITDPATFKKAFSKLKL